MNGTSKTVVVVNPNGNNCTFKSSVSHDRAGNYQFAKSNKIDYAVSDSRAINSVARVLPSHGRSRRFKSGIAQKNGPAPKGSGPFSM